MGKGGGLAEDAAQAESGGDVEAGCLQPPVVECKAFRDAVLGVELAVLKAVERTGDKQACVLDPERAEEQGFGNGSQCPTPSSLASASTNRRSQ